MPTENNVHLEHIKKELNEIEDTLDDYQIPDDVMQRVTSLRMYVSRLSVVTPNVSGLVRLCEDCKNEEANPGLDVCGPCYGRRIGRD
jgi:Mg2+ and Co2+ transporter CorA